MKPLYANFDRSEAGYAHMGEVWFRGLEDAREQGLITAPVR